MRLSVFLLLALPLVAQHGQYLNESRNPAIGNPQAIAAGAKLYATSCAACHGPDGSGGRGPNLVRRTLWHPLTDQAIFNTIRNGVPGADMPPTKLPDDQTWQLVAFIHSLTGPASENPVPGDPEAGARVFWSSRAGCSNCHAIRGRGSRMGPDLSNIGGSQPLAVIKESILTPSKDLTYAGKEDVSVTLRNGQTVTGIARNRSNYSLQVVDRQGDLHLLSMADVAELTVLSHSPMPGDYGRRLSREELRDLLAYLARQSVRGSEPAAGAAETSAGGVRYEDICKGPGENWLTYAGSYQGWRYSPLRQISVENAGSLVPKWTYHVPAARGLRTSPVVYDGVMYVTNSNAIYALDARNGRQIWSYLDARAKRQAVNRGAAILGNLVYFTTADNYLTALDRRTGSLIFSRPFADVDKGITSTSAPLAVKDKIIVGSAGGDSGMRGFVAALSPATGEEIWRTYTVPARGEPGAESWGDYVEWGGGATWLSGTFDPQTNTLYWATGNPWPDFSGTPRKGTNLYTCSLIALDLATGKMKWYFQFTPHDTHDWDAQSWPVLIDMPWRGQMRKVVLHANRNGFFYVLDRTTGEFLRATQLIDKVTWASGIDDQGRPMVIPGKEPTPEGNWVCPSVKGATNWMGQSYNPGTGLLYLLTLEQCGMFTSSAQTPVPMKHFGGGGATEEGGQVILRALDPKTGKRVWQYPMTGSGRMWTGTVSTAAGVLFSGDDDGHLVAFEAKTGKNLWRYNMGELLTASPITYAVDSKQYVAIASATSIFAFGLFEPASPNSSPVVKISE